MTILAAPDEIGLLVTGDIEHHDHTGRHLVGGITLTDDRTVQQRLDLADARLHAALLILRRVVLRVLAQIPMGTRDLDLRRDPRTSIGAEVVEFCAESVVRLLAEERLGHNGVHLDAVSGAPVVT